MTVSCFTIYVIVDHYSIIMLLQELSMWNAISSGLQAVQDRLDNVIDDVTSTQNTSQSEMTTADETDVSERLPSVVEGANNNAEVRFIGILIL